MTKMIVIYEEPKDKEGFDKYYFEVHMKLVQQLPNLKNANAYRVLDAVNTENNLYLTVELEYDSVGLLNESLASEQGKIVQGDVANLLPFLHKPPVIITVN